MSTVKLFGQSLHKDVIVGGRVDAIPGGVRVVAFWQANEGRSNTRLNSRMTYGGKCQNREIEAAGQDSRQSEGARRVYKAPSRPPRLFFFQPSTNSTSTQNQSINQPTKSQPTAIMSDKNTSTLQSYVDSATGAVQSAIGSLTGNTSDQVCSSTCTLHASKTNMITECRRGQEI